MTPALEEAQRLLRLALRDRDTFELLCPLPTASMAAIGFHAQQAVEKCSRPSVPGAGWKSAEPMIWWHWHTHWLTLATLCPCNKTACGDSTPFAVEFRYDDECHTSMTRKELGSTVCLVLAWAQQFTSPARP